MNPIQRHVSAVLPTCDLTWIEEAVAMFRDGLERAEFDQRGWIYDPETGESAENFQLVKGLHGQAGAGYEYWLSGVGAEREAGIEPFGLAIQLRDRVDDRINAEVSELGSAGRDWSGQVGLDLATLSAQLRATGSLHQLFEAGGLAPKLLLGGSAKADATLAAAPLLHGRSGKLAKLRLTSSRADLGLDLSGVPVAGGTQLTLDLKLSGKGVGRLALLIFGRTIAKEFDQALAEILSARPLGVAATICDTFGAEWRAARAGEGQPAAPVAVACDDETELATAQAVAEGQFSL